MEVTAKEIQRQATRLTEEGNNFTSAANDIIVSLARISSEVKSEDSNLSNTVERLRNNYIYLHGQVKANFDSLANLMNNYAIKTIKNEEEVSLMLSEINASLQNLNSELHGILGSSYTPY